MFRGWLKDFLKRLADWLIDRWFAKPDPETTYRRKYADDYPGEQDAIAETTKQNSSGKVGQSHGPLS